jgi:hypothetical protein
VQVTALQKTFALTIFLIYLVLSVFLLGFAYWWISPQNDEQYKNFGVMAGIALTFDAALTGILGSFLTLSAQSRAAKDLADKNEGILKRVEDHKKDILESIENLKGQINRQNEFLSKTLDAKSAAYNKLFVATTSCYRELQNLAKGEYDKKKVAEVERVLHEAEALSANLDDEDRQIVAKIVQAAFNIRDEVEALQTKADVLKKDREAIWNKYAPDFGREIEAVRDRSPFYNQKVK